MHLLEDRLGGRTGRHRQFEMLHAYLAHASKVVDHLRHRANPRRRGWIVLVMDEEARLMCQRHVGRVTSGGDRELLQLLPLLRQLGVCSIDGEPTIANTRRPPYRELRRTADPEGDRAMNGLGQETQARVQLVVLTVERRLAGCP